MHGASGRSVGAVFVAARASGTCTGCAQCLNDGEEMRIVGGDIYRQECCGWRFDPATQE